MTPSPKLVGVSVLEYPARVVGSSTLTLSFMGVSARKSWLILSSLVQAAKQSVAAANVIS